jgi:hypothetical protein
VSNFSVNSFGISTALRQFVLSEGTADQGHIKPMHQYVAARLVLEGGFLPSDITPHPPLRCETRKGKRYLFLDPDSENKAESTLLGGVKSKAVDVVVQKNGIGPTLAISVKGTRNAFRNLTNRMEEMIGDSANLHMMYPGLIYGYLHLIKANRGGEVNISPNDICLDSEGKVVSSINRWHSVLSELTGRTHLTDDGMRYEAISLLLVDNEEKNRGTIFGDFPISDSPLLLNKFFQRLYMLYDFRYSYKLQQSRTRRAEWPQDSKVFSHLSQSLGENWVEFLGYLPRLHEGDS